MLVYHYCSLESLNSILKHRALRLTNILKSNDSMEIQWICRYFDQAFHDAYDQASDLVKKYLSAERYQGFVQFYTDEYFNENHANYRYYVTCFSYQDDLLSQWRGYADDGQGMAIGFDLDVLKQITGISPEISKPSLVSLHEISYSEKNQRELVQQLVQQLLINIDAMLQREVPQILETYHSASECEFQIIDKIMKCFEDSFLKLFQTSVYMKNPFFSEESEIRLCEFSPKQYLMGREVPLSLGARLYNYSYYVRENQFVSYVDFDFSACMNKLIRKFVIGPKCLTSARDVEYYLETFGLLNCQVCNSKGTYR